MMHTNWIWDMQSDLSPISFLNSKQLRNATCCRFPDQDGQHLSYLIDSMSNV